LQCRDAPRTEVPRAPLTRDRSYPEIVVNLLVAVIGSI